MRVPTRERPRFSANAKKTWASIGQSAGARMIILPLTAVLGIISTRLIIENYGAAAYAQYGLLVGIGALLPFVDLGISAVIMKTVAESPDPARDEVVRRILITSVRLLFLSGLVVIAVSLIITFAGGWTPLLGGVVMPGYGPIAAALCLCAIGATLPFGIGQRILTGLGKNHVTIVLMGLQSPVVLIVLIVLIKTTVNAGPWLAVVPYAATMALSVVTTLVAARRISPQVRSAIRSAPRLRAVRGGKVFHVAWPMLTQMIALPLAMQSDRIVLSHLTGSDDLASYNLASQMYNPIWQVASAAGLALWPIFARQRTRNESSGTSPAQMAVAFGLGAAAVTTVISLVSPWVARIASAGEIQLDLPLILAFSVLMVFQSMKVPLGMYMTDVPGLRFQAYFVLLLVPVNLGLSLILTLRVGAAGPVIGSAVAVLLCQVITNWWYVRRKLKHDSSSAPETAPAD